MKISIEDIYCAMNTTDIKDLFKAYEGFASRLSKIDEYVEDANNRAIALESGYTLYLPIAQANSSSVASLVAKNGIVKVGETLSSGVLVGNGDRTIKSSRVNIANSASSATNTIMTSYGIAALIDSIWDNYFA